MPKIPISQDLCLFAAWAQEAPKFMLPAEGGYIKEWLLLGPFSPDDLEIDFLADMGGEANMNPGEGNAVAISMAEGKTRILEWKLCKSRTDVVDLIDAFLAV